MRRTRELRWRLIQDGLRPGAENMALDHALAACLGTDEAVVRLYGWSRPTVSFGKNEPAAPVAGGEPDYVRRPTGGRAVLHDDELTYCVAAPLDAFGGLREAYAGINEALAGALRSLGAGVDVAEGDQTPRSLDAGACFRTPARGELVRGGRKLVGSAQARLEGALLQHGSILLGGDQGLLAVSAEDSGTDPVTLRELVGDVSVTDVAEATGDAFRRAFGGAWHEDGFGQEELEAAERLRADRYGRDTWTWRRRQEST